MASKIEMFFKRQNLGRRYMEIARELQEYERIPRFLWNRKAKERVVELLEEQSEMDIELGEILIACRDYIGVQTLKNNMNYVAGQLWNLKRDLAR